MLVSWFSYNAATHIGDWANVFFIASLVVGVVSTIAIVGSANVKEWYWDKDRREANERIEKLRAANLALEIKLAPRSLNAAEINDLTEALKPFAGTVYEFMIVPTGTADTTSFASNIFSALEKAEWILKQRHTAAGGQFGVGVKIGRNPNAGGKTEAAVQALVAGLKVLNIESTVGPLFRAEGAWLSTPLNPAVVTATDGGVGPDARFRMAFPDLAPGVKPTDISIMIGSKP